MRVVRPLELLLACSLAILACTEDTDPTSPLGSSVDVIRDDFGVVHIRAQTEHDVFYASGYMQAYDRLLQMSMIRLRLYGRRAEVDPSKLDDDVLMRVFGIAELGAANQERMLEEHPDTHELVEAWTQGVNARIQEVLDGVAPMPTGFDELGFEPELFDTEDAYGIGKLILFSNANQLETDLLSTLIDEFLPSAPIRKFAPMTPTYILPESERPQLGNIRDSRGIVSRRELPSDTPERLARFQDRVRAFRPGASNNWAISAEHTENGRSLIAGDPHQPLRSPSIFHMQHLTALDGSLDVGGFAFVGTPGIQLGHNRDLVWTATTTYPDFMDLVEVLVRDEAIVLEGESLEIESTEESFTVRGDEPHTATIIRVPGYGVILPDDTSPLPITRGGRRIMLRWIGFEPTIEAHAFLQFGRAQNLDELAGAAAQMELGAFNFIAADASSIRYVSQPAVPDRGEPGTFPAPYRLIDGDSEGAAWTGARLSPDVLPDLQDPPRGWLASANNDPYGFTEDGAIEDDEFYFGVWFDPGTRAARIESELQRLIDRGNVTRNDMEQLQLDTYSVPADLLLPFLFEATSPAELEPLVARLQSWDRHLDLDSSDAVLFTAWAYAFVIETLGTELGLFLDALLDASPVFVMKFAHQAATLHGDQLEGGTEGAATRALEQAAAWLTDRFGGVESDRYRWGDIHGTEFRSEEGLGGEFALGFFPTPGGDGTVNVSAGSFIRDSVPVERISSRGGPIYRMVAEFGEDGVPEARICFPTGHSADPSSPWYASSHQGWLDGDYSDFAFREADIDARATESYTLSETGLVGH